MLIILIGSISVYTYYLKEKKDELLSIQRGYCPKCHQDSIELTDQRSSGCSSPKLLSFECMECGYTNSFAVNDNINCNSKGCR